MVSTIISSEVLHVVGKITWKSSEDTDAGILQSFGSHYTLMHNGVAPAYEIVSDNSNERRH
jgi:hypothetical protein